MPRFSFGPFTLDPAKRLLTRGGEPIALTPKAFDTLRFLVEERATALSKDVLLSRIWPDVNVEESNLAQIIFTLRRALGDDPLHPAFIATVPRHGYRFVADVVEHAEAGGSRTEATHWRIVAATLTAVVLVPAVFAFLISRRAVTPGASNVTVSAGTAPEAPRLRRPPKPEAYDFYLRGRKAFGPEVGTEYREERERAREWYEKALQIDPTLAEAYSGLAAVEFGRYSQGWNSGADALARSRQFAEKAISLDPALIEGFVNLIAIEWTLGRSEEVLRIGRRIERTGVTDIKALRARADAYHFAGLGEKAAALMARVVTLDPSSRDAQHRFVSTLITARRYQEASVEAERYFARFPDLARTRQLAGLARWSAGDLVSARKELEAARRLAPTDMVIGINLAGLLWVSGDRAGALRLAEADVPTMEKMATAYPDNVLTHAHLASQYGLLQRAASVREQEQVVMRMAGGNGGVVSQIGFAYANMNDLDRAIAIWTRALQDGFTAWDGAGDLVRRYPGLADMPAFHTFRRALDNELSRLGREY